jgi:Ni/Fe-hydrogenase 1 B-type cytochrome subunit
MELQQTAVNAPSQTTRTKKYSPSIRLWHWLNAIIITGSLLTVLINSTVLKPWANAGLIADKLKEKGINVSDEQTRSVAFALSDKVWAVHTYLGYTLVVMFIFRFTIELLGFTDKTLIRKITAAKRSYLSVRERRIASRNEMLIKTLYAFFYVFLTVMVVTGLALAFRDNIPAIRSMHFIRDIHEFTMYLILGFIAIHLAGVLIGERKQHKGIVSDMINGGNSEM